MKVKSESEVAQSHPTLSDPMDCSLLGSSVHGIFQARVLEWVAIAFSDIRAAAAAAAKSLQSCQTLCNPIREKEECRKVQIHRSVHAYTHTSMPGNHRISSSFLKYLDNRCTFPGCNGTPLQYSCLENPMDGGA